MFGRRALIPLWTTVSAGMAVLLAACGGAAAPTATRAPAATTVAATSAPAATAHSQATAQATAAAKATLAPAATAAPTPPARIPGITDFPNAKRGGTLNITTVFRSAGWEPYAQISLGTHAHMTNIYDRLIGHDPADFSILMPMMAKSWTLSPDATVWTLNLNRGITFHDGSPFTAADVAFTFNDRIIDRHNLPTPRGTNPLLKEVKALDDYTVSFQLSQPYASFVSSYLSYSRMAIYSKAWVEKNGYERMNKLPLAPFTGPFMMKEFVTDSYSEMVRYPNYWIPGRPYLDSLKLFIISDPGAAFANFLTGQVSVIGLTKANTPEAVSRLGTKLALEKTTAITWTSLYMNMLVKPLDDPKVRQAIGYGIDKEGFCLALGVDCKIGGYMYPNGGFALSDQELSAFPGFGPDRQANLAKAKALLAEAGYPKGFAFVFLARNDSGYMAQAIALQSQLKDIGLHGELKIEEATSYFDAFDRSKSGSQRTDWTFSAAGNSLNGGDPNDMLESFHLVKGGRNAPSINDPFIEKAYADENRMTDPVQRKKDVQVLERYLLGINHYSSLTWGVGTTARYTFVKNDFTSAFPAGNAYRDVWLER